MKHDKRSSRPDPYLPSGVPFPVNLLQPLSDDPVLKAKGAIPLLSDQRLSRTLPTLQRPRPETLPLKIISRKAFRAIPALSARMKYHKAPTPSPCNTPTVLASLDIEIPVFAQSVLELRAVTLKLTDGTATDLVASILPLPLQCRPRDNTAFLYRLTPHHALPEPPSASQARNLEVTISATVLVSALCRPQIEMRWRNNVDFSTALNPSFGKPSQSMQRSNRPASLPGSAKASTESAENSAGALAEMGITLTFSAAGDVRVGEPFSWDIFLVNRSAKTRKLVITVVPQRAYRTTNRGNSRPPSSTSASQPDSKTTEVANPVTDENTLYTSLMTHGTEHAQLVCLTTDIKIG